MANRALLKISNLEAGYKVYEGYLAVLDGMNLEIVEGERVGLVGEAGCGKTTAMKCLLRILPIPPGRIIGGQILFRGQDVLKMTQRQLGRLRGRGVSMIFQDPTAALNPVFTVGDQLAAVIRYGSREVLDEKEIQQRAVKALKEVQLPDPERILSNYPVQLSGGMRQRICIAMALATEPELLVADEPTTSLDVTIQDQVLRLLHALVEKHKTSVIFITHSLGVVREMADRVYVMYAGTIVEEAPTAELFAQPLHPYTQGLLRAIPKLTGEGVFEGVPGRLPSYLNPPPGCRFRLRCQKAKARCDQEKPRLVEVGERHRVACFVD